MRHSPKSLISLVLLILVVSVGSSWWASHHKARIGDQVAALAVPGDIRMLSSDTCAICAGARHWFTSNQVAFLECSIERDTSCRADFDALHAPGTPVVLVRGAPQLGFDPKRVLEALQPAG